ncbi:hypothetical protein BDV12DRAFT_179391 [Aspergillus spectabilis]
MLKWGRLVPMSHAWGKSREDLRNQAQTIKPTAYIRMLLDMEKIPMIDNILAVFFSKILLAGYLVFPSTFTSLQSSESFRDAATKSDIAQTAYSAIQNTPLLGVAGFLCAIGLFGSGWLCYRWRTNFVWLSRKIFMPILITSITGLLNTLISIYTAHSGTWSITAKVTTVVTGSFTLLSGGLFLVYNNWLFMRLEKAFRNELNR